MPHYCIFYAVGPRWNLGHIFRRWHRWPDFSRANGKQEMKTERW